MTYEEYEAEMQAHPGEVPVLAPPTVLGLTAADLEEIIRDAAADGGNREAADWQAVGRIVFRRLREQGK